MEKNNLKQFVWIFVGVILAVAFITSIATQTNSVTSKTIVVNESYDLTTSCIASTPDGGHINESDADCNITVTNYPTGWKVEDCPLTSVTVHNDTGGQSFTASTDYNLFASSGVVQLLNTTATQAGHANTTEVNYKYCAAGYVNSSWGRNILGVNVGLFAIAILIIVILLVYTLLGKKID